MGNHLALVAGLLLSSCLPMDAQILPEQIVPAQTSPSLTMILFSAPQVRFSLILLQIQLLKTPFPHPALLLAAAYKPEPSLESRLQIEEVRTPLLTESRSLIAHLWRGLQLDVFDSTLQLDSPRSGSGFQYVRPSSHDQAGIASSVGLDGISLRYSLGRDAETRESVQIWRCVLRITGNARGCPL
jgi:hypothetical protein